LAWFGLLYGGGYVVEVGAAQLSPRRLINNNFCFLLFDSGKVVHLSEFL
jgi:hypothetical protein